MTAALITSAGRSALRTFKCLEAMVFIGVLT
jgi:hypothetical protein